MELRDYQQRAIEQLYDWFRKHDKGNPCLVLPTGAGKSWIIAALCRDALQQWPDTTVLMLTHVKELIEQDAEKMRLVWPNAPMGIYSASLRRKDLGEPITFAGIQSVRGKADQLGHVDLIIIDEAHLVSHKNEGSYRKLIADLRAINPHLRVIGLTATPWRLGHGRITDGSALFDDLIEPTSIEELVYKGHLCNLRSKVTKAAIDTSAVHKRGGEFVESELQALVDQALLTEQVVEETIRLSGDRKAWLFFCVGVAHAEHVKDCLNGHGIAAACVTSDTPKREREEILVSFKAGEIRAMTNANVLTTGFDYPDIDLIAMLRPTMSPSLYVQMAGRGMRPKRHTDHCLVLDFAGAVKTHGPVTAVQPPKPPGKRDKKCEAPTKVCDECGEICHLSAKVCPTCETPFPVPKQMFTLNDDDIMGIGTKELGVKQWIWRAHTSKASGKEMVKVAYYGGLSDPAVTEYLPILHEGYAGQKALSTLAQLARNSGAELPQQHDLKALCDAMNSGAPPSIIEYTKDGKFNRVLNREWRSDSE